VPGDAVYECPSLRCVEATRKKEAANLTQIALSSILLKSVFYLCYRVIRKLIHFGILYVTIFTCWALKAIKYKQKWERSVKKSDDRDKMRESDEDE
jgi:predicted membrane protein